MTLVRPEDYIYFVVAAYTVAAIGLTGLLLYAWSRAHKWTAQADALRAESTKS
jgi:hypothetical protein